MIQWNPHMDADEYHDMTRSLIAMMVKQDTINERLTTAIERIDTTIERLTTAVEDIKTLIARNIPLPENGGDVRDVKLLNMWPDL